MLSKKRNNQAKINKSESFLSKLHDILNTNTYDEIIHWDTDGKRIIIADVINLCNVILPKFYKHHNYSSFVRQLNMYGFHKSKGIIKSGEGYEHDTFCRDTTKDEINKISRTNKKMKNLINYIKSNKKDDSNEAEILTSASEDDVLKYLYEKNEENVQKSMALKKEMDELRKENVLLNEEIAMFKSILDSHKMILEKILRKSNEPSQTNCIRDKKVVKSLNDLFNKYLYYLKIYSPYVNIDNNTTVKSKTERNDIKIITNVDNEEKQLNNQFLNDNENESMLFEDIPLLLSGNEEYPFQDLVLQKNCSSKSFLNTSKYFK